MSRVFGMPAQLARRGHVAVRALVTVVAGGTRPEYGSVGSRRLRLLVMAGFAAWCVLTAVHPPSADGYRPVGMALAIGAVVPVVLAEWSPMWAWRIMLVMAVVSPWAYPGLSREFDWPWTPGLLGAALLVLYRVGCGYRRAVLLWVFVLTACLAVALPLSDYGYRLLTAVSIAVCLALGHLYRLWRHAELDRVEQRRRRTREQTRAAALAERTVIARELHDVVAHHMSLLALRTDSARYRYPDLSTDLREEFAALNSTAREGLDEMRWLLRVLRSTDQTVPTTPQPGTSEIKQLVDRVRDGGVDVALRQHGDLDRLPAAVALSTYRIAQEALSNAMRHAPGARVTVDLDEVGEHVRLAVRNDVDPTDPAPEDATPGHGLDGMRERAAMLGGTLEAGPDDGGGFAVTATLPTVQR